MDSPALAGSHWLSIHMVNYNMDSPDCSIVYGQPGPDRQPLVIYTHDEL